MSETAASPTPRKAIFLSVAINCLMALTGTAASLIRPLRWLGWVARIIAAPPGFLLRLVIRPAGNSVASYAIAATAGLIGSLIFYALIAWGVLWLIARLQSARAPESRP
jgi:hypothetical protein